MPNVALDNDVVLKMAYYRLLPDLTTQLDEHGGGAVLGAEPFVLRDRVKKDQELDDPGAVQEGLDAFFDSVERLEPTLEEESLAADLEVLAARHLLELDTGESQLCAIVVIRLFDRLITGDKRAIRAIENLLELDASIEPVIGRVACLEQAVVSLALATKWPALRAAVCSAPAADQALQICFQCSSPDFTLEACCDGLASYIEDLRKRAAKVLATGLRVWET